MASVLQDPTEAKTKNPFEELFEFVATTDDSAYLCIEAALKFRNEVCGGEEAIMSYCQNVSNEGADAIAAILGTNVLQEPGLRSGEKSSMRACALTTVRLPIGVADGPADGDDSRDLVTLSPQDASRAFAFIHRTLMEKYDTFVPVFQHGSSLWTRLSGQVYVEKSDFEWLGGVLRELCEQVARGDF